MSRRKKEPNGCGCGNVPISVIILVLAGGYWWFIHKGNIDKIVNLVPDKITNYIPGLNSSPPPITPTPPLEPANGDETIAETEITPLPTPSQDTETATKAESATAKVTPWEQKAIRGIYLSRYQITNNADEATIRQRVRYYRDRGFNTIIHGVWGNGCTMYESEVMQQKLGFNSCPNQFRDRWLEWLIDEAHKHDMQVHAYFEKGIKIDKNSPIFDLAIAEKWLVPGVDRTYAGVDHYVLDVEIPEVANFFRDILAEFVQKYPNIDAVQWDDYLGYHAELPGKVDRTASLTNFTQQMIEAMKQANPSVSFDLCHHNPYWAKRYFAADWKQWDVDRVFVQAYNDVEDNFQAELDYAKRYAGIAITDNQFHRLDTLIEDRAIDSILIFPLAGKPQETANTLKKMLIDYGKLDRIKPQ